MSETSPEKIGWMFIQEYYTRLNKDPLHLYQFYTKQSTLIHGFEGETPKVASGQAEVQATVRQQKLFKDCQVFVSSVDCLGSHEGGIVIQVTGEMNNAAGRSVKFAQTFFLAPSKSSNGYYVLNDILRFLGEDEEDDQDEEIEVPEPTPTSWDYGAIKKPESDQIFAETPKAPESAAVAAAVAAPVLPKPAAAAAASLTPSAAADKRRSGDKKDRKVFYSAYLKNITKDIDPVALRQGLEKAGEVTHLQIETEKSRAFVDFIDQRSLDLALGMKIIPAGTVNVVIEPRKRRKPTPK